MTNKRNFASVKRILETLSRERERKREKETERDYYSPSAESPLSVSLGPPLSQSLSVAKSGSGEEDRGDGSGDSSECGAQTRTTMGSRRLSSKRRARRRLIPAPGHDNDDTDNDGDGDGNDVDHDGVRRNGERDLSRGSAPGKSRPASSLIEADQPVPELHGDRWTRRRLEKTVPIGTQTKDELDEVVLPVHPRRDGHRVHLGHRNVTRHL